MAKKKDGEGSNLGLIITLVFFVLATVILGVTTYMGYSDMATKDKAVADKEKERKQADDDAKHYRMIARAMAAQVGESPAGVDQTEVARDYDQFDKGQFGPSNSQKDKDAWQAVFKKMKTRAPWDASRS